MNTPLRRVGMVMMVMIVLLLANATYVQVIKGDEYRKDPRNQRVLLDEYARQRGQLIAGDQGTKVLANVQETNDRLKYLRTYADGPVYAPVTGYYSITYGTGGMERVEDDVLNGSDDRLFVRRLSDLITGRDPRGGSVALTINPKAQEAAYNALQAKGFTGSVVAIRPQTGEILAMASTPSYEPNRLSSHDGAEQQKAWQEYTDQNGPQPLLNRAVNAVYPPGSTFKLVVTAAALADGKTKDTQLTAAPRININANTTLENYNGTTCGSGQTATLTEALAHSCNTAFAELSHELGPDKLRDQAAKFGIGQDNQTVPLPVARSCIGPTQPRDTCMTVANEDALYATGIGQQDVLLTPLQNAVIAATIANGGQRMQPYLVKSILGPDLSPVDQTKPTVAGQAMSSADAATLRDMMLLSEQYTGGEGQLSGVKIASKTGTAEHGTDPRHTNPHAWYVAFAPAENPQVAVAVVVENGGDRGLGATGGKVAAPIGRAVIGAVLGSG